jgi:hypothetical protein
MKEPGPVRSCGCRFQPRLRSPAAGEAAARRDLFSAHNGPPEELLAARADQWWLAIRHLRRKIFIIERGSAIDPRSRTVPSPHAREPSSSIQTIRLAGAGSRISTCGWARLSDARSAFERHSPSRAQQ